MKIRFAAGIALIAAALAPPLAAQEPPPPPPPQASQPPGAAKTPAPIPLKVTVVLSRYQGEKRVSSMPYVLGVMASGWGAGPKTTLRMGVDVPVTQTSDSAATASRCPSSSYNYRDVGTNIDCGATFDEASAGHLPARADRLRFLARPRHAEAAGGDGTVVADVPSFRNFNSSFTALLRDGQTMQYTSATDPVIGRGHED